MNLSDLFAPDEQGAETRIDLEQAIGRLTFREAAVLYLWAICEKSQSEIGEIIGLSQRHVRRIIEGIKNR